MFLELDHWPASPMSLLPVPPTVLGLQVSAPNFYTGAENCNSGLGAYAVLLSSEPPHLGF